jgi:glycosyltransferase involved in cell wall biosynthesis
MKIAFITRSMWAGGAERVIAELVKYMTQKNIECEIFTLDKEKVLYTIPDNVKMHAIGEISPIKSIDKLLRYKELRRLLKSSKPDIVLALPEDIGIYVIPAMIGTGIPVVVSERNNPWVMPWKKETRLLRKLFYPLASGYIFQTRLAASFFSKKIQKKGIVLPNPLDLSRVPEPFEGVRRKEIVGAGRLDKQKNFPLLIRAFAEFYKTHPEYKLTIYGEGKLLEDLKDLAKSVLPSGVFSFPGRKTDLLDHIRESSIFILSSDYEGMPNVVIEAMAMGVPVISTDCPSGGPAELIDNGVNGLLVPVGDLKAMSEAMSMVAESQSLAKRLGGNALNVRDRFNASIVVENWMEYLEYVVSNK